MSYIFQPIRKELQNIIRKHSHYIQGEVLDVGAGSFDRYSSSFAYKTYSRMDIAGMPNVDIEGIAENIPTKNESFDSIVCTQTLSDVWNVPKAFSEFNRVLRTSGILMLTSSFMDPLNEDFGEYWRFTPHAYRRLAEEAGFVVEVLEPIGGYWSVRGQFAIRRQIRKWNAYNRRWRGVFNFCAKVYGTYMLWRDSFEPASEKNVFTHGHILIARKK